MSHGTWIYCYLCKKQFWISIFAGNYHVTLDLFRIWLWQKFIAYCTDSHALGVRKPKITTILVWDHENLCLKGSEVIMTILIKNAQNREGGGSGVFSLTSVKIKLPKWKLHHVKGNEILFFLKSKTETFIQNILFYEQLNVNFH